MKTKTKPELPRIVGGQYVAFRNNKPNDPWHALVVRVVGVSRKAATMKATRFHCRLLSRQKRMASGLRNRTRIFTGDELW